MSIVHRHGLRLGCLHITWLDLWTGTHGLEIAWRERALLYVGFRRSA